MGDMLWDDPARRAIKKIIQDAEEPLTVHEIIGRMTGKRSQRRTEEKLDELIEDGVVEKGPPETADGVMGLVEREPTYQQVQSEEGTNE